MDNIELLYYIVIAGIVTQLPVIGPYVSVVNTFLHEFGHAIVSLLLGGKVQAIRLFTNTGGVAVTATSSWLARNLTALAGYPFASFSGYMMIYCLKNGYEDYLLYTLFGILALTLLVWIRNLYGFFWILTFGAIISYFVWDSEPILKTEFLYFITAIVYIQSLYSALVILYLSLTKPDESGDAKNLSRSFLIIPAFVWGILFAGQAIFFAYEGLNLWLS